MSQRLPHLPLAVLLGLVVFFGVAVLGGATASAAQCSAADDFSGAAALPLFPSCFEGADGNMLVDGPSAKALDWGNLVGSPGTVVTTDGTGNTDNTFQGGSNEEVPGGWSFVPSPSSPKDDIFTVGDRADPLTSSVFLYLGSILKAASGAFDESFELNQLSPGTAANPTYRTANVGPTPTAIPARKTGDLLLTFDTVGGVVAIGACTWRSDQPDPAPGNPYPAGYFDSGAWYLLDGTALDATNTKACTQLNPATAPAAQGAINVSTIVAADNALSALDVPAGDFGELSVDVTNALASAQNPNPCFNFASIWMRTRSSVQANSNPEDLVFPHPIVVANCVSASDSDLALANVPADMTVNATGPSGATVTYTAPSAADEDATTPTVSCLPVSGATFPIGATTVHCSAADPDDSNSPATASFVVTVNTLAGNHPPVCSAVSASPGSIPPPSSNLFKPVTLSGASDPDGDTLTYHIDGVAQDERVFGAWVGDPNAPDAKFTDANRLAVRAQRDPLGNGRVYRIAFTVSDGKGGSCSATFATTTAKVMVRREKNVPAVDGFGATPFDSFVGAAL